MTRQETRRDEMLKSYVRAFHKSRGGLPRRLCPLHLQTIVPGPLQLVASPWLPVMMSSLSRAVGVYSILVRIAQDVNVSFEQGLSG